MDKQIEAVRDVEGYLIDPEAWNAAVAIELAAEEALQLGDA
jgi:sulfur relay (sulfurtransferase) DsrC/TusE family protein